MEWWVLTLYGLDKRISKCWSMGQYGKLGLPRLGEGAVNIILGLHTNFPKSFLWTGIHQMSLGKKKELANMWE